MNASGEASPGRPLDGSPTRSSHFKGRSSLRDTHERHRLQRTGRDIPQPIQLWGSVGPGFACRP